MKNLQRINDGYLPEYFFATTNFPEALDKASVRSGRINEKIEFKMPDYDFRKALFEGYVGDANAKAGYGFIRCKDFDGLAEQSKGFSCSDVEEVVNRVVKNKLKVELRKKVKGIVPAYWIGEKYLFDSLKEVKTTYVDKKKKRIGFV
jgi:SpoVK/Ycf46/Vps4 family AAA+-type ATPase